MELFLQFGHGMKALTLDLAKKWKDISVILSPRDMTPEQLISWSKEFAKNGVKSFFDPQCYCPKSELKRLSQYEYWDSKLNTHVNTGGTTIDGMLKRIKEYNDIADTRAYIVPCMLREYNEEWSKNFLHQINLFVETAKRVMDDKEIYATLSFPKGFLIQNEATIEPILQEIADIDVDGFYIIAEALEKKYLVDNPMWLSNILHICATLKVTGKKVIFGYGNHQMLPLSLAKVDAMASGTWLNVRSFTNRFIDSDEQKRKSTWVYYPEALSEYKLAFIDWAYNNGMLDSMKPRDAAFMDDGIRKIYEAGVIPSSTGFNETDAFKHYLCCLRHQVELLNRGTYKDTLLSYEMMLNTAEREIERLEKAGVYAQARSFRDVIDVNRAAIMQLDKGHGFQLNMSWTEL